MVVMTNTITLTTSERTALMKRAKSRTGRAEDARRARVILLLAEGRTWDTVCAQIGCSRGVVALWRQRFIDERLAGLYSRHRGQAPTRQAPRVEARILEATRQAPADGSTHWSTRKLAAHLGVSHMRVARVWAKHGLKPHRLDRYLASTDPDFERKATDVIGLYLNPPQHAAVFCVDENTAIQTLGQSLGANASQLFQAQGSSRSAMPVAANGDPDWSRVTSFDEVPAELVASIPDEVVARIQRGGAGGSSSALPRNIFTHPTPK